MKKIKNYISNKKNNIKYNKKSEICEVCEI